MLRRIKDATLRSLIDLVLNCHGTELLQFAGHGSLDGLLGAHVQKKLNELGIALASTTAKSEELRRECVKAIRAIKALQDE